MIFDKDNMNVQDWMVMAMMDLYPEKFIGKSDKEIIDQCYDIIHPFEDYIFSDFNDHCIFLSNEDAMEVMQDIIMYYIYDEFDEK